jgi:hypothetical protein
VCNVIGDWIDKFFEDFANSEELVTRTMDFIEKKLAVDFPPTSSKLKKLMTSKVG